MSNSTRREAAQVMNPETLLQQRARFWNAWSANMITVDGEREYIVHMFEALDGKVNAKTLCGVKWLETGLLTLNETTPGCIRCRRILRKRGLLES